MFEEWNEALKNQPDWLEVSLPPGTEQRLENRLKSLNVTKEQAVQTFVQRILATVRDDDPKPSVTQIADSTICDLMTQLLIEPTDPFYRVELPDYACPAFVTWTHDLFGTLMDIDAFLAAHTEEQRKNLGQLQLTAVPVMATRTAHNWDYEVEHLNVYGWPYIMHSKMVESVHVWVKYGDRYYRCIRARMDSLAYSTPEIHDDTHPLEGHSWGYPHIIEYVKPYTFNRLYEVEAIFETWEEAEKDIKAFDGQINLTEVFNDILGDG